MELLPDAKGPRASPGSYSVRDLMRKMMAGKVWLWQCIFQNRNGGYDGYFPGTDPMATKKASELADDPAGYLKCFLLRQGWTLACIKKLITKSFDEESAKNANLAKWDRKNNRVISGGDVLHAEHNAALDNSFINRDLGRTDYERSQDVKESTAARGEVNMSDLGAGSFGAFEFGDDQSAKTARTAKSAKTYQLDSQSKFTIETGAEMEWDDDDNMDEADDGKEMGKVEIELPPGGINSGNSVGTDSDGSSEVVSMTSRVEVTGVPPADGRDDDSVQSNLPPSNLSGKFGKDTGSATNQTCVAADAGTSDTVDRLQQELGTKFSEVETLRKQMKAMVAQMTVMQGQLQVDLDEADDIINESDPGGGITNRTDINAASSSRSPEQEVTGHENPSTMDGETQEAGEMANVPSQSG